MPIYIQDSTPQPSFFGKVEANMGSFTTEFAGSTTPQPDIDGSLNRALGSFTVSFKDSVEYPLLGTNRQGSPSWGVDNAAGAENRIAIGLMDASILGPFLDAAMDTGINGFLERSVAATEVLAGHPVGSHSIWYYVNSMEKGDEPSEATTYVEAQDGPGSSDGFLYDGDGIRKANNFGGFFLNLSDYVAVDVNGYRYPEWYSDNRVTPELINPHIVGGVKIGGPNGINLYYDNYAHFFTKSLVDPDFDGTTNNMQSYYDPENASHVSADPIAVLAMSAHRRNMTIGMQRNRENDPGIWVGGNTNQWVQGDNGPVVDLRNVIVEYRKSGDEDTSTIQCGFSENNSRAESIGAARSGVAPDGTLRLTGGGSWQEAYNNGYHGVDVLDEPAILFYRWRVQCLQSSSGDGNQTLWPPIPASNANWGMWTWVFCTAQIAGAHICLSGIQMGTDNSGNGRSTPLFDEMGLINGSVDYGFGIGTTKLYRKWAGPAIDPPQTEARFGTVWGRETENALFLVNPDNNEANSGATVTASELPGGVNEWMFFNGVQNPSNNDGSLATTDFTVAAREGATLVRRSWYEAL